MGRSKGLPGYLHHKSSGRAFVRINGSNIYLGRYNSKESREEYDRIIQEWLVNDRRFSFVSNVSEQLTVDGLCAMYLKHARSYYRKNGKETPEVNKIEVACQLLHKHCGKIDAINFTRKGLKTIREELIDRGWKRKTINERIGHVRRIFKWGAEEDLLPAHVFMELKVMGGLKKGRSACRESEPVKPVSIEIVNKTLEFCQPIIADMAKIQYLSGMRPGEICALRACDIDRNEDVWVYDFKDHKTAHHGHERTIWFGSRAQAILTSYLIDAEGNPEKYLFSPREAVRFANIEKRQKRKTKVQPSQKNRAKKNPKLRPGDRYEVKSYRRALQCAAEKAGVERWSPNQLRHTRATEIRKEYGLEAAQIILGHEKADVTQIYAERDKQKGVEIMRKIG